VSVYFTELSCACRPLKKMNADEKELLQLLRRKLYNEKKALADEVGQQSRTKSKLQSYFIRTSANIVRFSKFSPSQ